ncbi:MAG: Ig-like domain-containing protein [Pseudomonadota bacterium]
MNHTAWAGLFAASLFASSVSTAQTAPVQHFDAANEATVVLADDNSTVSRLIDLSDNALDALPGRGAVIYPSTILSESGLPGLHMGSDRNDLIALSQEQTDNFLNFQGSAAGNQGFTIIVSFTVDELIGRDQFVLGTTHLGFHLKIRADNLIGIRLTNPVITAGSYEVQPGDTAVVSISYDAASGAYTLWDSKNQSTRTGTVGSNIDFQEGRNYRLGEARHTGNSDNHFRGMIGEVMLFDEPLSAADLFVLQQDLTEKWTGIRPEIPEVPPGPGFRNIDRPSSDVEAVYYSNVFVDPSDMKARTVDMGFINGFLHMTTRGDAAGEFSVWDVSDEFNPLRVASTNIGGKMHTAVTFVPSGDPTGSVYYYNNNSFLNVRDPLAPFGSKPPGYDTGRAGARGLSVLPYEYSGGSSIRISDARTGRTIATLSEHGFVATPTPLGNLLLVSGLRGQARGAAIYDISDPSNPALLDVMAPRPWENDGNPGYEYAVWKHFMVLPNALRVRDAGFISFEDPTFLKRVSFIRDLPGATRYAQFQDDYMFLGHGKYLMTPLDSGNDPEMVAVFSEQGHEYMLPLGNLIASAENTEQGRPYGFRMYAHQSEADRTPPRVYYHSPAANARFQHVRSRIGVIIHETLDLGTVNTSTFRVFPSNAPIGADVPGTLNVHDKDILNFTPDEELLPETTYTVLLDGIADVSGNVMHPYQFEFSTSGPGDPPPVEIVNMNASDYPAPIGAAVNFSTAATGGLGALEYRWDFGDESTRTDWSSNPNTTHEYASEGHYTVKVQVRDESGRFAKTSSIVITATDVNDIATKPPTNSSQLAVDTSNRTVWAVNPDNNTVTAVHSETLGKIGEYPVCIDPRSVALDATGRLWVTCIDSDLVQRLDATSGRFLDEIALPPGSRPYGVVFDNEGKDAWVSLQGSGQIARISMSSAAAELIDVGKTPRAMAAPSDVDELWVTRFVSPDSHGEVSVFETNGALIHSTATLQKDTTSEDSGNEGRGLPNYLAGIAISPDNRFAYVASKKDNIDRGDFRNGNDLTFETTSRSIVSKIDLTTRQEVFADRLDIDNASQPSALQFSPLGDYLFVALQGSNEIRVFDMFSGSLSTVLSTDLAPQALAFDAETQRLFVKNLNSRTLTIFDLESSLRLGFGNEPIVTTVSTVANERLSTSPGNNVLRGKQVFYNAADPRMSQSSYISCALCHQDGGHDGRTWDFTDRGEGLRNTTNLRGRSGMAHGRVHWSANFDEIQDFEIDIRRFFGGTGFIKDGNGNALQVESSLAGPNAGRNSDLDALAAYVTSLGASSLEVSPFKSLDGSLTDEGRTGEMVFDALDCGSCHNPATAFTDSATGVLHDVGTLKSSSGNRLGQNLSGIDTPTLLGVHASAPYLHDGRAETLEALFDPSSSSGRGGEVNQVHDLVGRYNLSTADATALVAFLLQLDGGGPQRERIFRSGFE